jgi:hypothetical protein
VKKTRVSLTNDTTPWTSRLVESVVQKEQGSLCIFGDFLQFVAKNWAFFVETIAMFHLRHKKQHFE